MIQDLIQRQFGVEYHPHSIVYLVQDYGLFVPESPLCLGSSQ